MSEFLTGSWACRGIKRINICAPLFAREEGARKYRIHNSSNPSGFPCEWFLISVNRRDQLLMQRNEDLLSSNFNYGHHCWGYSSVRRRQRCEMIFHHANYNPPTSPDVARWFEMPGFYRSIGIQISYWSWYQIPAFHLCLLEKSGNVGLARHRQSDRD